MEYILLDSGTGRKLERLGSTLLSRPDPQAIWPTFLSSEEWQKADASFHKSWKKKDGVQDNWVVEVGGLQFAVSLKNFKHTGVFPEHVTNWEWIREKLKALSLELKVNSKLKILNLFGYTGGATLVVAKAGAEAVHVDASKPSVQVAKENAKLNGLENAPIRWILDDAKKFVEREVRRGAEYDAVIMDPPVFGRGAKGEIWKIEEDLLPLLQSVKKLLKPDFKFILLNGYASQYTSLGYAQLLTSTFHLEPEEIEFGELCIEEDSVRKFKLPAGIFARWARK
ncbi:MAG: class I SAM-dependent methyltransferase [Patescibacteria group bacterium]